VFFLEFIYLMGSVWFIELSYSVEKIETEMTYEEFLVLNYNGAIQFIKERT